MNNTGQQGAKTGYRVLLLLVVGLTAFSSAMKDLSQVQQFTVDAGHFIAQLSGKIAPADPVQTVVKVETCNRNGALEQSAPTIELPWVEDAESSTIALAQPPQPELNNLERPVLIHRSKPIKVQIAKPNLRDLDPVHFEVRISPDNDNDTNSDEAIIPEVPSSIFKAKARRHGAVRISTRDREMLLKTLNRSFTFRIAS